MGRKAQTATEKAITAYTQAIEANRHLVEMFAELRDEISFHLEDAVQFLEGHIAKMVAVLVLVVALAGGARAQQTVFPTLTAPPEQSEMDPLEAPIYVLGSIPSHVKPADLVRTEYLAPYEVKFLAAGSGQTALQVVAEQHGMAAGPGAWVTFHGRIICQYRKRSK